MNNSNTDLPITALCIVTDKTKCPSNYVAISKSYDMNVETDLWKDGLFGKKINRFICYTKDYPINEAFNVIEDIKLLNEKENIIGGFIPIEKCFDNISEKSFQKKVLCIKIAHRFFTHTAVSDIIILVRTKRPPTGYSFIGEINNHTICVKFSPIQNTKSQPPQLPMSMSTNNLPYPLGYVAPPPIPPRPMSVGQNLSDRLSSATLDQGYVLIDSNSNEQQRSSVTPNSDLTNTLQRYQTQISHHNYNPLQGVPFEINPIYDSVRSRESNLDLNELNRSLAKSNNLLKKLSYDYRLEATCLQTNEL